MATSNIFFAEFLDISLSIEDPKRNDGSVHVNPPIETVGFLEFLEIPERSGYVGLRGLEGLADLRAVGIGPFTHEVYPTIYQPITLGQTSDTRKLQLSRTVP